MGHLGELHAQRTSQNSSKNDSNGITNALIGMGASGGENNYNLLALSQKPNKRKKSAILKLD